MRLVKNATCFLAIWMSFVFSAAGYDSLDVSEEVLNRLSQTYMIPKTDLEEMSTKCEWLEVPSFRLRDAIALHPKYGAVVTGSGVGYYRCSYNKNGVTTQYQKNFSYTSTGDGNDPFYFDDSTYGIGVFITMYKPNYPVISDSSYLYAKIRKAGTIQAVDSYYFHQIYSISVNPEFAFSTDGISITSSISLVSKYNKATGVVCFRRLLNQSIGKSPKTYNLHNHERSASYEKKRENHCSLRAFEP